MAQRAGRGRGRDRLHQRGQRRRPRPRGPALVRHGRAPGSTVPIIAAQVATVQTLAGGVAPGPRRQDRALPDRLAPDPAVTPTENVIAETRGGDPNKVDRRRRAPRQRRPRPGHQRQRLRLGRAASSSRSELRGVYPKNKIRFIWFSAEESGLLGSEAYVDEPAGDRAGEDRGDAELRHDRLAELRQLDLRRRPLGLAADRRGRRSRRRPGRSRRRSRRSSWTTSRRSGSRTLPTASTAARTTARSSPPASRRAACSPAPRASRRRSRPRSSAASRVSSTTRATTSAATTSSTCSNRALDLNSDAAAHVLITLAQSKIPDRPATAPSVQRRVGVGALASASRSRPRWRPRARNGVRSAACAPS